MLGFTQDEVVQAVDVSIQQIQKYEKARNRIASGKLFTLAKFLTVPINYFLKTVMIILKLSIISSDEAE